MSHRLRTMRGLKFDRPALVDLLHLVASFAYDAWIEMLLCIWVRIPLLVASFAYDAWIEISQASMPVIK